MLIQISQQPASEPSDLFDRLLECHQRIRQFISLAGRIAQHSEAPEPEIVEAARRVERYFSQAFPLHVADEESSLEPRLRHRSPPLDQALQAMHEQHSQHRAPLERLLATLAAICCAPSNLLLRRRLGVLVAALEPELEAHLQLEETVLFPAARRCLTPEMQRQIIEELRHRRQHK